MAIDSDRLPGILGKDILCQEQQQNGKDQTQLIPKRSI